MSSDKLNAYMQTKAAYLYWQWICTHPVLGNGVVYWIFTVAKNMGSLRFVPDDVSRGMLTTGRRVLCSSADTVPESAFASLGLGPDVYRVGGKCNANFHVTLTTMFIAQIVGQAPEVANDGDPVTLTFKVLHAQSGTTFEWSHPGVRGVTHFGDTMRLFREQWQGCTLYEPDSWDIMNDEREQRDPPKKRYDVDLSPLRTVDEVNALLEEHRLDDVGQDGDDLPF